MAMPREEVVERDVQAGETEAYAASQWQLMWWKFRKHRMAMAAGLVYCRALCGGCILRVFGALYTQSSAGPLCVCPAPAVEFCVG